MTEAASAVRTGEVTTAVKDAVGKTGKISNGEVIGITGHEIEVVGTDVLEVAVRLAELIVDDADTLTILAGEDLPDDRMQALTERLQSAYPDVEVEAHRGDQPLYPVIIAAE